MKQLERFLRFRPTFIKAEAVSAIAMVNGNEKKHPRIIDNYKVKYWVGFGWITERDVEFDDYKHFPVVIHDDIKPKRLRRLKKLDKISPNDAATEKFLLENETPYAQYKREKGLK